MTDSSINEQPNVEVHRLTYSIRGPEWGFAVPQGNLTALTEVMSLCSEFWNGIGSLIIPVRADGRIPSYVDWSLGIRAVEQVFTHSSLTERAKKIIDRRFTSGRIYDRLADDEIHPLFLSLSGRPPSERKICVPMPESKRSARIALACWGAIREEDIEAWRERYEVDEASGAELPRQLLESQIEGRSPLQLSARYMSAIEQHGGFDRPPVLYGIGAGTFDELVLFWNLRSRLADRLGMTPMLGIPRELISAEGIAPVLGWLEKLSHGSYCKPDVLLFGRDPELSKLKAALRHHDFREAPDDGSIKHSFPNPPKGREVREYRASFALGGPMRRGTQASSLVTFSGRRAILDLPKPEGVKLPFGYVRLSIRGFPLPLPMNAVTAGELIAWSDSTQDGLQVKTNSGPDSWRWDLTLPTEREALEQWGSAFGYRIEPSQPGRFGQALLNRLDQFERLDALADEVGLEILSELAPRSTKKLAQRIGGEIERRSLAEAAINEELLVELLRQQGLSLQIEAKTLHTMASVIGVQEAKLLRPLSNLVEAGLVRRGTQIICQSCNFAQTFALSECDEWVRCRTCGQRLANPVALGDEEYPRSYFLDGLAAQLVEQDLLPVILALRRARIATPEGESFFAWPGLLFKDDAGKTTDGDLVVSNGQRVWIYECKSRAEGLGEEQTQRLLALCTKVGAHPRLAALRGCFAENVARAVTEAGGDVLGRTDLLAPRESTDGQVVEPLLLP
jgi:hypothetical protein